MLDVLAPEAGAEKVKTYHPDRAFYFQVDISNLDQVASACEQALKAIPKGSLFGGVHCAAIAPSRPWTNKMKESAPVRIDRDCYSSYGILLWFWSDTGSL